uniref:Midgut aminopeptidase N3 n=1 Tax=Helicoverpa armigera TaxID=29058 RepID=Q7Z266_HELAM|nr:midgut aminopeptidase N3 [Helicoverpa armigera]
MAAIKLLVLSLACACVIAHSPIPPVSRTIFLDERLEGGAFENIDAFKNIELSNAAASPYRLPNTTIPTHYKVLWVINLSENVQSYSGTVDITLQATQPNVNEIVIHCDHLTVTSVVLRQGTATEGTLIPTTPIPQSQYHFLRVALNDGVLLYNENVPVQYTLSIAFNADMRDDMYGIYRSWYRNLPTDTNIKWMATTQFQATAARYALPCYDEPGYKAKFDVTIRRPLGYKSWFCTRQRITRPSTTPGYEEDEYHTTPEMSTYLLALIVAEYDSIATLDANNRVLHEVIARPGAIINGQAAYAQRAGQDLLAEMSDHTDFDFYKQDENLKMTQAAIPDFGAGAMENWGLLTYREAYILYDEQHTSSNFKQIIAYILSHEIAHMWFGNLVTNAWWDVLWLNEGFARYYQYFLTAWVEDMGLATRFINEQVHASLLSDSSIDAHPLTNPGVGSPAAVSAMFSTITYNKGASVIRMTEHLLGFEVHRAGLRKYLEDKKFKTVQPIDLFTALETAGNDAGALDAYGDHFDFVKYYESWTEQPGHPVLNVHINHQTGHMTIYQRRFDIDTGYSVQNRNYIVPITFTTGADPDFDNTKPSHVISKAVTVIDRGVVGDVWTIFNIQQTGFYRVNYDDYTWDLIILALRGADREKVHEYNRAQIVNDVFQFARSGLMTYERALNILSYLENETDYAPWVAAITGFNWLRNRLVGKPQLAELNAKIVQWSSKVMSELTYMPIEGEPFMRSYLRWQLAPVMCNLNVPACRAGARVIFENLRLYQHEVPVDSRSWVYCNALRDGGADEFNHLYNRFKGHNVYTEKILILQTLGCTSHSASLTTLLNDIVTPNNIIRPQDYTTAFSTAVSGNEENTLFVLNYIQNNLETVLKAFSSPRTPLSYIAARLRTVEDVTAYQTWLNLTTTREVLGTSYNNIYGDSVAAYNSILWVATVEDSLSAYLTNGDNVIQSTTSTTTTTVAPTTVTPPPITEPSTPSLPVPVTDGAMTSFASLFIISLGAILHLII